MSAGFEALGATRSSPLTLFPHGASTLNCASPCGSESVSSSTPEPSGFCPSLSAKSCLHTDLADSHSRAATCRRLRTAADVGMVYGLHELRVAQSKDQCFHKIPLKWHHRAALHRSAYTKEDPSSRIVAGIDQFSINRTSSHSPVLDIGGEGRSMACCVEPDRAQRRVLPAPSQPFFFYFQKKKRSEASTWTQ